jgi:SOS-response transcriptional repressor LexA
VFYFLAPDDSMRGLRVCKGDLVLCVPAQSPIDGAIMLCEFGAHRALRKVKLIDSTRVLLQSYGREYDGDAYAVSDVKFAGRAVRLEAEL